MSLLILGAMPAAADPRTHLAAGPWCFCGQEAAFPDWEKRFSFAPEPLRDPALARVAARAAQTLAARAIPVLAASLTPEPQILPASYWQVLLAPFAIDLASQVVERALRVDAMRREWGARKLTVPLLPECQFDFADEQDFTLRGSLGEIFNLWLFSRLLLADCPPDWQQEILPPAQLTPLPRPRPGMAARARQLGRDIAAKLPFPKMKGMEALPALEFSAVLALPLLGRDHSADLAQEFNFEADLAQIPLPPDILDLFPACLPRSLRALRHERVKKTSRPRLRVGGIQTHENASLRQELARWRAAGNRIGYFQHGGNYGQTRNPCAAEFVEYSQDVFFTWGWETQGGARGNFLPLPSFQLGGIANSWHGDASGPLLFVGTEMPVYGRRLDSHPTPLQYVEYRAAKARFFEDAGEDIRGNALYRPYFPLPGTLTDADWLLPRFPQVKLCRGALLPQMLECRLLVLDHHGTTLLEAMVADAPMLLYWQRTAWPLAPECDILIDLLENCGVWHATPGSAAKKAREIWDDPKSWWQSPEIRMARDFFCRRQALVSGDAKKTWLKALKKL